MAKCIAIAEGNRINLIIDKGEDGYEAFAKVTKQIDKHGFFCWLGDVVDEKGKERCGLVITHHLK